MKSLKNATNQKYMSTVQHILLINKVHFFLLIVLLSTNSCHEAPETSLIKQINDLSEFNEQLAQTEFNNIQHDEKANWFLDFMNRSYENEKDADEWVKKTIEKAIYTMSHRDIKQLGENNYKFYRNGFEKSGVTIAQILFKDFENKIQPLAKFNSAAVLAMHYNFLQNKDSLEKYVEILDKENITVNTSSSNLIYLTNKANLFDLKGDFFEAAVHYRKALHITPIQDSTNRSTLFQNMAVMYLNMDYIDKAKQCIDSTLAIYGFNNMPLDFYNSIGVIQYRSGDFTGALKTFDQIIEIAETRQNLPLLAQSYANLSSLKRKTGEFQEALRYLKISDSICTDQGIKIGVLINQINLAQLYFDCQEFEQAEKEITGAKEILINFQNPKINKEFYELFYKIEDALGHTDSANKYYRLYNENLKIYVGDLPRSAIAEWELSTEREKRVNETTALSLSIERQKSRNYLVALFALLVLLLLSGLLLLSFRQSQKTKKRNALASLQFKHELELTNKELLSNSLQQEQINNVKTDIHADLGKLISELPKNQQARFQSIRRKLKPHVSSNHLDEFEVRFKGVNDSFYIKLNELAPDLTPNELRICAFMKINITTKDMAILTNRTTGTIENVRISIRRKLKLDKGVNLQQYILSL